jgi:hypothetical protein
VISALPPGGRDGAVHTATAAPAPAPGHPSRLSGGEIVASGPCPPGPGAADTAGSGHLIRQQVVAAPGVDGTGPYVRPGLPSCSRRRTGWFSAGSAAPTGDHPDRGFPWWVFVVAFNLAVAGYGWTAAGGGVWP